MSLLSLRWSSPLPRDSYPNLLARSPLTLYSHYFAKLIVLPISIISLFLWPSQLFPWIYHGTLWLCLTLSALLLLCSCWQCDMKLPKGFFLRFSCGWSYAWRISYCCCFIVLPRRSKELLIVRLRWICCWKVQLGKCWSVTFGESCLRFGFRLSVLIKLVRIVLFCFFRAIRQFLSWSSLRQKAHIWYDWVTLLFFRGHSVILRIFCKYLWLLITVTRSDNF